MNDEACRLFERVSRKMSWSGDNGVAIEENKWKNEIGKQRRNVPSEDHFVDRSGSPIYCSSDDEDKENQGIRGKAYIKTDFNDSSDDEFDQCLVKWATPKCNPATKKPCSTVKIDCVLVSSDDDSGNFEKFLQRVKTPSSKPRKKSESESEDSLEHFIVDDDLSDDDFIQTKSSFQVAKKKQTPATQNKIRRPLSDCASATLISDSEDDSVFCKSTWRTRHTKPTSLQKTNKKKPVPCDTKDSRTLLLSFPQPSQRTTASLNSPTRTISVPSKLENSSGSEEEFVSLLDRIRKKNILTGSTCSPNTIKDCGQDPPVSSSRVKEPTKPRSVGGETVDAKTPGETTILKSTVSQTEPRHGPISRWPLCKTPGCFLETLSNPTSSYCYNFKQKKEDLTSKLYNLYNASVFDMKLPVNMSVTWNKKMRKTAGYCITGQERAGGSRYARIELSEKVCDSADRLRDTLIHEMCHAATWLINGVRDGHGRFWKLYAHKSTLVHPELPMVTRCHSYDIKYKFQYKCTRCQNTIGRHSKSLDTQKFVCALCTGKLVLLTPSKPRPPTPFAKYVKEHYGSVRKGLVDQKHAEVMRKLSADFASKSKLTDTNS
nr:germ cell nuclear acidic protein-like [Nerophis lumbriciformis]